MEEENTKKIIIDGKEVVVYLSTKDDEIEDNRDLISEALLGDTINLTKEFSKLSDGASHE